MSKFKVGDKVRVRVYPKHPSLWDFEERMDGFMGKTVTISSTTDSPVFQYHIAEDGEKWWWRTEDFESISEREFIVIRRDGSDVIASHKRGDEIVKTAKAKCAPSDEFNFDTGAKLAFDRLVGREEPKPKTAATAPKFKVGDRVVQIVSGEGTIERVVQVMCVTIYLIKLDTGSFVSAFEHLLSPAPEPKYYTGKVFAVRTLSDGLEFPGRVARNGRIFEIINGKLVENGAKYGLDTSELYGSFLEFCCTNNLTEWAEVKE